MKTDEEKLQELEERYARIKVDYERIKAMLEARIAAKSRKE